MVSVDALLDDHKVGARARVEELRDRVARVAAGRVWSRVRIHRIKPRAASAGPAVRVWSCGGGGRT
jgi:hypothetical protein